MATGSAPFCRLKLAKISAYPTKYRSFGRSRKSTTHFPRAHKQIRMEKSKNCDFSYPGACIRPMMADFLDPKEHTNTGERSRSFSGCARMRFRARVLMAEESRSRSFDRSTLNRFFERPFAPRRVQGVLIS